MPAGSEHDPICQSLKLWVPDDPSVCDMCQALQAARNDGYRKGRAGTRVERQDGHDELCLAQHPLQLLPSQCFQCELIGRARRHERDQAGRDLREVFANWGVLDPTPLGMYAEAITAVEKEVLDS